jgi:peptidyl-prolyl cis-trans isomerase B (cyclophilin B)
MNKVQISIAFVVIAGIVGFMIYHQSGATNEKITQVPTVPPESSTFKFSSPPAGQQQQVQGQQQTQQQGGAVPTFGVDQGVKASYSAVIKTTRGSITVTLSGRDAPKTVKNFVDKIQSGFYKGLTFHRVEDWVVQGGDPKGNGTGGGVMQTELNNLSFVPGSLGIARGSDIRISNDSQFFITKIDSPQLNQQYTNFGVVTEGMDVVNTIKIGDKILDISLK